MMTAQLNVIVLDPAPANCQEMAQFLMGRGLHVMAQLPGIEMLESMLARPDAPDMAMVNLDPEPFETLRKIAPLIARFDRVSFFVMSEVVDANLLMEALHVGVREFVPLPADEQKLVAGIERLAQLRGMGKRGRVIHVIPTTGGCGSTTVACNVGVSMARHGRTVLVDLDLVRGSAAVAFDLRPRYTIADLMDPTQKLDQQLLDNALAVHEPSGLAVLGRPDQAEDARRITPEGLERLLNVLAGTFDYIVIDSVMSVEPLYTALLRRADLNVMVIQLNIPSIKNAERFIGTMRRLEVDSERVRLVVNRFVKRGEIGLEMAEKTLGMKIAWMIPNDFRSAIAAVNFGEPVVLRSPRSGMSSSLVGLAGLLNGRVSNS